MSCVGKGAPATEDEWIFKGSISTAPSFLKFSNIASVYFRAFSNASASPLDIASWKSFKYPITKASEAAPAGPLTNFCNLFWDPG